MSPKDRPCWIGCVALSVACAPPPSREALTLEEVVPATAKASVATPVSILGGGFRPSVKVSYRDGRRNKVDAAFTASLGYVTLTEVTYLDRRTLQAVVPAGLVAGSHDLEVTDPEGRTALLVSALTVEQSSACAEPPCDGCSGHGDCDDGLYCNGAETCDAGTCAAGADPCPEPALPVCDEPSDTCRECGDHGDCDDGLFCNGAETCDAGTCAAGADPCTEPALPVCDEPSDTCRECGDHGDCDDGLFCNGAETCDAGTCAAGADPCTEPALPVCDEPSDTCRECGDHGDCDDGLFCNGAETCDAGTCAAGADPCTEPALPACDEPSDTCRECGDHGDCDDGLFCNGAETCDAGTCAAGADPCTEPALPACDEPSDTCRECGDHGDCDDGLFCNGAETCDAGTCAAGADPCTEPALPACDEPSDTCHECGDHGDCDDGLFCNGAETCDAGTCAAGADPCTEPALPACDEPSDTCLPADTTPPTPGDGGRLQLTEASATTCGLGWNQATDDTSLPSGITYCVYTSSQDNLDTPAEVDANGTLFGSCAAGITALSVDPLPPDTVRFLNVLVSDEAGNRAVYDTVSCVPGEEITYVPPGVLSIGWSGFSEPIHDVALSDFYVAKYEVTYALWESVRIWGVANGYTFANNGSMGGGGSANDQHPVTRINWYDAVVWLNAYSERSGLTPCYYTGVLLSTVYRDATAALDLEAGWVDWSANGFRLPTSAEWETAARNGGTRAGDEYSGDSQPDPVSWHWNNSSGHTHAVGELVANELGAYDMSGNVWEWCWDWHDDYVDGPPFTDPDTRGPAAGTERADRGGSYYDLPENGQTAWRWPDPPVLTAASLGFRLVRRP